MTTPILRPGQRYRVPAHSIAGEIRAITGTGASALVELVTSTGDTIQVRATDLARDDGTPLFAPEQVEEAAADELAAMVLLARSVVSGEPLVQEKDGRRTIVRLPVSTTMRALAQTVIALAEENEALRPVARRVPGNAPLALVAPSPTGAKP